MSLGCVRRRKIDTGAELIASACTILNLPNVFLMLILSANRKKITKYKRSEYGVKYNIRKDYVPTIAVLETLTLAAVAYFLYTLVNPYFFVNTPDFSNYVKIIIDVASTMLIRPMAGEDIANGEILIDGGKIAGIGVKVDAPEDAEIIDAEGRLVTPGIVEAHCHTGDSARAIGISPDHNEKNDPLTPSHSTATKTASMWQWQVKNSLTKILTNPLAMVNSSM